MPTGEVKAAKEAVSNRKRENSGHRRGGRGLAGRQLLPADPVLVLEPVPWAGPHQPSTYPGLPAQRAGLQLCLLMAAQCQAINKQPSPADKNNWKTELIKRRDLKIIVGMNKNKKLCSLNLI